MDGPGASTFEGRALLIRGNHAGRDADPKDGVEGEKHPGLRDNANHVKKLRWGEGRGGEKYP